MGGIYRIYNLCSERTYDSESFVSCCQKFIFEDHNSPPFAMALEFCEDVHKFLGLNPDALVGVHCKAGKGRTGIMICCYLLYCGFCASAI